MDRRVNGRAIRVLAILADTEQAQSLRAALGRNGLDVTAVTSAGAARAAAASACFDVAVIDDDLLADQELELMGGLRCGTRPLPTVILTDCAAVRDRVGGSGTVQEFLAKSVSMTRLVRTLVSVAGLVDHQSVPTRVVAIGAHPDDVEIGIGGTLLAHRAAGHEIVLLTLSTGARGGDSVARAAESRAAADLLGARLVLHELPDTRIAAADPTVGLIEQVLQEVKPGIVYTHSGHDVHQDHRAVHQASIVAARSVGTVACYQSPSATVDFRPNRFVDVSAQVRAKVELIGCFASQAAVRAYLADDVITSTTRYWSRYTSTAHAEPLEVVREQAELNPGALVRQLEASDVA